MKAVVYEQFAGPIAVRLVPDPSPPEDGAVVRVIANGVCRTDWHGWQGHIPAIRLPNVPGHELAGVVEEIGGAVTRWKKGDRVTAPFNLGCGICGECLAGYQNVCDRPHMTGFSGWGSFAEFVAIPHADVNLVRLPDELGFTPSAALGCRAVTAFRAVVHQARLASGEWIVVHGCGGVGLAAVMIASACGGQVIGVDVNPKALAAAMDLGATHALNGKAEADLLGKIRDLTGGGAHVALDALGIPETIRNAVLSLRKRGRHIQVGVPHSAPAAGDVALLLTDILQKELQLVGSVGMQAHAYAPMLTMIRSGRLPIDRLVRRTVPLEESPAVLEYMGGFEGVGVTVIDQF